MRISDWSSDVCSSDLFEIARRPGAFQIGRNGSPVGFEGHRKVEDMWPLVASIVTFAVSMSISPGPNNLMVTASGANFGFARTIPHMLGVSIGFPVMLLAVGLGLGQALLAWPQVHEARRWVAAAYLRYLAWRD